MAYLQDLFLEVGQMKYHGNGKFTGTCRYNTCGGSCLEVIIRQPGREGDEKYYPWHGEFQCKNNCSKSKILSNLHMRRYEIFCDADLFESNPAEYHCLFTQDEAKEFLKEEINFLYKVLQKPDAEWKKELDGCDLRFLGDAIFWLERDGKYWSAKYDHEGKAENPTEKNEIETLISQSSDDMQF